MNFVVVSKDDRTRDRGSVNIGKIVLVSFCQAPIFKSFEEITWQKDAVPNCYDKATAEYALKKYANDKGFEVREYDSVQKEFKQYKP